MVQISCANEEMRKAQGPFLPLILSVISVAQHSFYRICRFIGPFEYVPWLFPTSLPFPNQLNPLFQAWNTNFALIGPLWGLANYLPAFF